MKKNYKSCVVFKDGKGNHVCLPKESDKSGCVSTRMDLLENTRRMRSDIRHLLRSRMILPTRYIDTAMEKYPVLVGYKCGVTPPMQREGTDAHDRAGAPDELLRTASRFDI